MAIFHCAFDLDYIIHRRGAAEMAGHVRLPGADHWATEAELVTHATVLKAKGMESLPTCGHHNKLGHCLGHTEA